MDPTKHLIICKGEVKTGEVQSCNYNENTHKIDVAFNDGSVYNYNKENVKCLTAPEAIDPSPYLIRNKSGGNFFNIETIYSFKDNDNNETYWYLHFGDTRDPKEIRDRTFLKSDLEIRKSCLDKETSGNVFRYIKEISKLIKLPDEELEDDESNAENENKNDRTIFAKKFDNVFVGSDSALAKYLNPSSLTENNTAENPMLIFPFGCNNSQYDAVLNAMTNQISVIQGPPGTGKTQTILNIIANALMQDKSVLVVSNNNAATDNVYEKLDQYGLGFIVAKLGNKANKGSFISEQSESYPDFSTWKLNDSFENLKSEIENSTGQFKAIFDRQEERANRKQDQLQISIEREHFKEYVAESDVKTDAIKTLRKLTSDQWMKLWQECQARADIGKKPTLFFRIKAFLRYGIFGSQLYQQNMSEIITTFQEKFYLTKGKELTEEISDIENSLQIADEKLQDDVYNQSMMLLKDKLYKRYKATEKRPLFTDDDLWQKPYNILREYPVVTSTTFSSTSSLKDAVFDYLIMDEASQVDIATGALALSCAKNAVIVGDTNQLPHIVSDEMREKTQKVFDDYRIDEGYYFEKSFLQSLIEVMPNVKQTLLREHYRCHPKIINFCNQKFYRDELVVMTEDKGEKSVLVADKTVPGEHRRENFSQRQVDIIKEEIIPNYVEDLSDVGIITPYRDQVAALQKEFPNIDVSTVHKFQGREKDTIIISTVDDEISDFVDDPYLINVAVSRAKNRLILVVTGNPQTQERNIIDLLNYIDYNNCEIINSQIYSVFDYLYRQYTQARIEFLKTQRRVSEYDSENLMYALINSVLSARKYVSLDVVCHLPLNMLIRDPKLLEGRETQYAMNPATHVDFLIYNRISKRPILAIEVDGYQYHKSGTKQASRDEMKNEILERYDIPYIRLSTTGSGEKEKLINKLNEI